jgi:hypothetical protein
VLKAKAEVALELRAKVAFERLELSSKCYKKAEVALELKAKVASLASLAFARLEQRLQG